ncbi:MAG: hypothetical protein U1E10_03100 [Bdellovibrionales bacterium]|nr:hypothetical protein [Bdellovibrionales bacterium]
MNRTLIPQFTFIASLVLCVSAVCQTAAAQTTDVGEEDDYVSYEKIVDDLQSRTKKQPASQITTRYTSGRDPFENVWIHAGVGFAQTTQNIDLPNGTSIHMAGRGVQATLGIDILGPNLSAEGSVRNFGESEDSPMGISTKTALKEFDLKVLFRTREGRMGIKAGGGLSARYMTVRSGLETFDITTPASVLQVGGDFYLSQTVSVGLDLSVRTAMISETFDRASYDGTLRLDTHF